MKRILEIITNTWTKLKKTKNDQIEEKENCNKFYVYVLLYKKVNKGWGGGTLRKHKNVWMVFLLNAVDKGGCQSGRCKADKGFIAGQVRCNDNLTIGHFVCALCGNFIL